jgi:homoserine/homoserine lactone efflux protein
MDTTLYISFLVLSAGFILIPGPNVVLIVATSISSGRWRGLQAVMGTTSAMAIQLFVAAAGTAWLASFLAESFVWFKWAGVAYLFYLGCKHLLAARQSDVHQAVPVSSTGTYWRGFVVSLINPKTILFFGAFLPQFVSGDYPVAPQIAALSLSFLLLAAALDSMYAIAADVVCSAVNRPTVQRWREGATGFLFLGASVGLAVTRRE